MQAVTTMDSTRDGDRRSPETSSEDEAEALGENLKPKATTSTHDPQTHVATATAQLENMDSLDDDEEEGEEGDFPPFLATNGVEEVSGEQRLLGLLINDSALVETDPADKVLASACETVVLPHFSTLENKHHTAKTWDAFGHTWRLLLYKGKKEAMSGRETGERDMECNREREGTR